MAANNSRLTFLLFVGATLVLTLAAGLMLFSTFMVYDDEGYVLFSYFNYARYGQLYGSVYSQYGPLPYVFYDLLQKIGVPLTHTTGRLITLAGWSGAAVACATITLRVTRSVMATLAVLSATFVFLWIMVSEPSHPGGMITLIVGVLAATGAGYLHVGRTTAWASLAGAACAALMLTKINVGAFAAVSTITLFLLNARHQRTRAWAAIFLCLAFVTVAFVLMRSLLGLGWVQSYVGIFGISAIAAIGAASRKSEAVFSMAEWRAAIIGGGVAAFLVTGAVLLRGTSWAQLLDGIVFGPMGHSSRFNLEFRWPAGAKIFAGVSGAAFIAAVVASRSSRVARVDDAIACLRILAAAATAMVVLSFPQQNPNAAIFAYSAPCLWLFLWPLHTASSWRTLGQRWLGLLFLGQFLHAFPVPGSQIGWGTFLALPISAIGAWDSAVWLSARYPGLTKLAKIGRAAAAGAFLAVAVVPAVELAKLGMRYPASRSLDLPGSAGIRVPDRNTATYRILTLNAVVHSDMIFSLPGMFSFNLWTGLPAPTLANVTHWFSLLRSAQQQAIIDSLEAHPRACFIVQKDLLAFLEDRGFAPSGPLHEYINRNFGPAFELDGFEFRIRHGRKIAPLMMAELLQSQEAPGALTYDSLLTMNLLLPTGQRVAAIECATLDQPNATSLRLSQTNSRIEMGSIPPNSTDAAFLSATSFPFEAPRPSRVHLYFNRGQTALSAGRTLIILRGEDGSELALVRLLR